MMPILFIVISCRIVHSPTAARWALCIHLTSWSSMYFMSRGLINSMEASLVAIGCYVMLQLADPQDINAHQTLSRYFKSLWFPRLDMNNKPCITHQRHNKSAIVWYLATVLATLCAWSRPTSCILWVRHDIVSTSNLFYY